MRGMLSAAAWVVVGLIVSATVIHVFFGETQVLLVNRAAQPLREVSLSGRGFELSIPELGAGRASCHPVDVHGESSLRLRGRLGGRAIDSGEVGYVEGSGGYRVVLTVLESGEVEFEYDFEKTHRMGCSPDA